jgi:S-DNA-T family DNA segregation ATPase FtsK/SpoIIIE
MALAASRRGGAADPGAQLLASPRLRGLIFRRLAELAGLGLALLGLTLLVALVSYAPSDPSLDTATAGAVRNLAGPLGAVIADLLLQGLGLAAALPGIALLAWAWRIAAHRGISAAPLRILALLAALPVLAAWFATLPIAAGWPSPAGPGGALGEGLARIGLAAGRGVLGPLGAVIVVVLGAALAFSLAVLGLGLSAKEWRAAARTSGALARGGFRHSQGAARRLKALGGRARALLAPILGRDLLHAPPQGFVGAAAAFSTTPTTFADHEPRAGEPTAPTAAGVRRILTARPTPPAPRQQQLPLPEAGWQFPAVSLLKPAPARAASGPSADALEANARLLETVLADYGVQGAIRDIRPGPVVTLYELEPAPGIRSARVIGLADDVARSLSVVAVRIATVPGRNVIGIEVPNAKRETVYLSELLESEAWHKHPGKLALALGKDISGAPVMADLARMPHLLIAGTTGSGKSVGVNAMILSLLYRLSPDQCRLIMIDPKMLELSVYEGIPHLMAPVVTEPAKAVTALKWTVREMERRYRAMSQLGVRNIGGYNERVAEARAKGEVVTRRVQTGFDLETGRPVFEEQPLALEPLPFIVVFIDEMADLMMVAGKEIEAAVQRLAQMARAAGIHVIMATQRPSVDVITGTIKANFPTRISFQVISKFDSRTILGEQGAEQLLGQGDMLYMMGGGRITRTHGPFVTDREVEDVVAFLRDQGEPAYVEEVTEAAEDDGAGAAFSGMAGAAEGERGLFDQAVDLVAREGKASTSFIQRHLQIGYNRAAKLIEQMEKEGIVSPANHVGKREILVRRSEE